MGLCDDVRRDCAELAGRARSVTIDVGAFANVEPGPPPELDPSCHYLDGDPADVAAYILLLDSINFGSGWFPTIRKRAGCSGYTTIAWALADRFRMYGAYTNAELRTISVPDLADTLGQPADHELIALYAQAVRGLGRFLGRRPALELVDSCDRSADRLARTLAAGMPMFADRGFFKRAQIVAADLALAGVAEFDDLDRLTIFADNLVPHVLRCDGVLVYDGSLAARIDAGRPLPTGGVEREIRACAVHACELLSAALGVPPRVLDNWLWNRGHGARYKSLPRHRCRCVFY
ncbi:MAG TPA: queuosine salvage family protein [Solirubrobacteraceae bacterium]|nr:queuosine salvage family protein [Solirubrobacteraceae bacterium]